MSNWIDKLIFSDLQKEPLGHNVLCNQIQNVKDIWNNSGKAKSEAIGIERFIKLVLVFCAVFRANPIDSIYKFTSIQPISS